MASPPRRLTSTAPASACQHRTLGIRLDSASEIAQAAGRIFFSVNNLFDFTLAVANVMLDIQTKVHLDGDGGSAPCVSRLHRRRS